MNYRGKAHEILFKHFIKSKSNVGLDNATLAVAYLFSADTCLWNHTKRQLDCGNINFAKIKLEYMDTSQYILIRVAQDLYDGTMHISLYDLTDRKIITGKLYDLILEAIRIRRYGTKGGEE